MSSKRITAILVCLAAGLVLASGARAQSPAGQAEAERERAKALWEEAVRAKGGRERLHSVQNLQVSSTVLVDAPRGGGLMEAERLYAMPGKVWLHEFTPHSADPFLEATVINLDRGLCLITFSPARGDVPERSFCTPTTWPARLVQDPIIYLLETKWVQPVPVRARVEGKGDKQVDIVETEVGGQRVDFYLDRKTRLPTKIVMDEYYGDPRLTSRMGLSVKLRDYHNVEGIQMPGRVIREPDVGPQVLRRDTERASYRFNVAHDPALFDRPIPKQAKSGDWKPRRDD